MIRKFLIGHSIRNIRLSILQAGPILVSAIIGTNTCSRTCELRLMLYSTTGYPCTYTTVSGRQTRLILTHGGSLCCSGPPLVVCTHSMLMVSQFGQILTRCSEVSHMLSTPYLPVPAAFRRTREDSGMTVRLLLVVIFFGAIFCSGVEEHVNVNGPGEIKYAAVPAEISGINDIVSNGMTRLMIAAMTGQLEPLRNYIDGGADVNMVTDEGYSALMLAIKGRFYYTAMQLIRSKTDLNQRNKYGMTPLLLAIVAGHEDIVTGLLDYDANPSIANAQGNTALMMACQVGSKAMVERLLWKGALVNYKSDAGDTALMFASAAGDVDIIKLLIEHGADVLATNNNGFTTLMFACLRGHGPVIELLVEGYPALLQMRDGAGRSALDHAIYNSHQEAVEGLVAMGADLPRSGYRVGAEVLRRREEYFAARAKPKRPLGS
jgi:ankyrin repeat protein